MSRAAKATLVVSIVVSSLTCTMYRGVLRDDERRRRKMKEREEDLLRSQKRREIYERVQQVEADTRGS
ncbi:hypothetical protein H4582DRAFT_1939099 [Lactarius indigo]|nr:hypothetical protein H4582DRAFT_1939099 [Lactarius indigo]